MKTVSETSRKTLNTPTFGLQGSGRRKGKMSEKIFGKIIVDNFHTIGKEIVTHIWEEQRVHYKIKPGRNVLRHKLIKLTKIK